MMKPELVLFNFTHKFDKLTFPVFTTIRSCQYNTNRKFDRGAIGWITLKRKELFIGVLLGYFDLQIREIPVPLIRLDTLINGKPLATTPEELVELLDQIGRYNVHSLTTKKRIFAIAKIQKYMLKSPNQPQTKPNNPIGPKKQKKGLDGFF